MIDQTLKRRFQERIPDSDPDECWEWQGSYFTHGYGRIKRLGKTYRAHRLSYRFHKGPIPEGKIIMHRCDNPSCVNPSHLKCGTYAQNNLDKMRKGRCVTGDDHHARTNPELLSRGEEHGRAHLSRSAVISMRREAREEGTTDHVFAKRYDVSNSAVHRAIKGVTWQHLNDNHPPCKKDRRPTGEEVHTSKIDTNAARLVLTLASKGWSNRQIANAIDQTIRLVRRIAQRKTWQHATPFDQSNAESMAFRRACARCGLALDLYEG